MTISSYEHKNLKNTQDFSTDIGKVTLVIGSNRSSKTAILEGISLAVSGKAEIGGSGAKLAKLIRSGDKQASAGVLFDDGTSGQWEMSIGKSNSSTHSLVGPGGNVEPESLLGDYQRIDDFWRLTGEQKWQSLSKLVSSTADPQVAQEIQQLSAFANVAMKADPIATLTGAQESLSASISIAKREKALTSASLQAPDKYEGEPINVLKQKIRELETFIGEQTKARKFVSHRAAKRNDDEQRLAKSTVDCRLAGERLQQCRERVAKTEHVLMQIEPLCKQIADSTASDNEIANDCRSNSVREVILKKISGSRNGLSAIAEFVAKYYPHSDLISVLAHQAFGLDHLKKQVTDSADEFLQDTLPMPSVCAEIDLHMLLDARARKPRSIADYVNLVNVIKHELKVDQSSLVVAENKLLLELRTKTEIESGMSIEDAQFGAVCEEEEYKTALTKKDALDKQLGKANQWVDYQTRQADTIVKIRKIEADLQKLEYHNSQARRLRGDLLSSATKPIEDFANNFLAAIGLHLLDPISPMRISVSSTAKTSALSIENLDNVDISAMAGFEQVVYGAALVCAFQQLSTAKSPLLLVESAELDQDSLSGFLHALNTYVTKGNAVVAHYLAPYVIPLGVKVIDRAISEKTEEVAEEVTEEVTEKVSSF